MAGISRFEGGAVITVFPTDVQERFFQWHQRKLARKERAESSSGSGSTLDQTATIRAEFPKLVAELNISSLLDAPCGDFHWMQHCDLSGARYFGADIIPEVIESNRKLHASDNRTFEVRNLICDPLPAVDLILCRDCLVHLSYEQIFEVLKNFKRSGSRHLLTTTFTERPKNIDLETQNKFWRALNLQAAPFDFPPPDRVIVEQCSELDGAYSDKSLGLWNIAALPV